MEEQLLENINNDLPEAKKMFNEMLFLSEDCNEEFYKLLDDIKKILISKNIDYVEFIKKHLYFFMDIACNVNDEQFLSDYTQYLNSATDFYRVTGRFERYDPFADEWFGDIIDEERRASNKTFNINKVDNVVFAYYTGYVVEDSGEFSWQGDKIMKFSKKFAKILLERELEYNYGDPECLIDELECDDNALPSCFDILGAYIDDNKLKFKNFNELSSLYEIYEICERHFPDMKFEATNKFNSDEGIHYFQYKFDEKISFKFINVVLKHFNKSKKR